MIFLNVKKIKNKSYKEFIDTACRLCEIIGLVYNRDGYVDNTSEFIDEMVTFDFFYHTKKIIRYDPNTVRIITLSTDYKVKNWLKNAVSMEDFLIANSLKEILFFEGNHLWFHASLETGCLLFSSDPKIAEKFKEILF